jgi:hypothetical protein
MPRARLYAPEETMKRVIAIATLLSLAIPVAASAETCQEQAAAKKLAGAALNSFMTKCQKQAAASCEQSAAAKKLAGAAKNSFETKCINEAVGKKT